MPRLLFVVHGMGVHSDLTWFPEVRDKLVALAAQYAAAGQPALSTQVEIVDVTYDSVFAKLLDRWNGAADAIGDTVAKEGISMPDLVGWLKGVNATEKKFFWSHVVDVMLYRYFPLVTKHVRVMVAQRILSKIREMKKQGGSLEVSFLCHSLGTSVLHDTLALLATDPSLKARAALAGTSFPFNAIFTVANVGRVLEREGNGFPVYASVVHPDTVRGEEAWCRNYHNFRHVLDPFTWVRRFAPVGWGAGYQEAAVEHFKEFNVHGFTHYLDHPAVHVPVLNRLVPGLVSREQFRTAVETYDPSVPDGCKERLAGFVLELRRMYDLIKTQQDPADLIRAGTQFYARAKEAYDACHG